MLFVVKLAVHGELMWSIRLSMGSCATPACRQSSSINIQKQAPRRAVYFRIPGVTTTDMPVMACSVCSAAGVTSMFASAALRVHQLRVH